MTPRASRLIHLGDLSWNQEYGLVCPTNRIGEVDVLVASQHGDDEAVAEEFIADVGDVDTG